MNVIVIESEAYQEIVRRLENIESHVIRSNDIFKQVDENAIEMSSREVMETLKISESTLYRWRQEQLIPFRYTDIRTAKKCSTSTTPMNRTLIFFRITPERKWEPI